MQFTLCIPCLFGLEGLLADEIRRIGLENVRPETGRVYATGTALDVARLNLRIRTGERVLITLAQFDANNFEDLYQGAKSVSWQDYIPESGAFPVKGHALGPTLRSEVDAGRIIKKAVADVLGTAYGVTRLPESGVKHQIQFAIRDDKATLYLDTTGPALYKRGYRALSGDAPLRETLAAGMVILSRYRGRDVFADPFCGSGTIAIEAALIARNRAPGLARAFDGEEWPILPPDVWATAREEARSLEYNGTYTIHATDVDPAMIALARENAQKAGVADDIHFAVADACSFTTDAPKGVIVTNPPYGERILEREGAADLYRAFGKAYRNLEGWEAYVLSAYPEFESAFGQSATKKRKLYNGMLKCNLYMMQKRAKR